MQEGRRFAVPWVLIVSLGAAAGAGAEEVKTPAPQRLDPVVVTATKVATPVEQLGGAVTVITDEEIEAFRYDDAADALRRVPGVDVQRSGGPGTLSNVRIRGAQPAQIQVLVDGMRVKPATTGQFDFSDVALDCVERIEVVRGPQATLYGADAIGGVVNFITKRGRGPLTASGSVEAGHPEAHRERFSFSGSQGPFDYAVCAGNWENGGHLKNADAEQRSASGQVGFTLPRNGRVALTSRYSKTSPDLPIDSTTGRRPFFVLDPDSQQQSEQASVSLQWDQKPVTWYEVRFRVGQMWNNLGFQDPLTPAVDFSATVSQINNRRREFELVNVFHVGPWNTTSVGLEYRDDWATNRGSFVEEVNTRAAFLQDEVRLFDRLFLTGAGRIEDNEAFGTTTTPRFGAVYIAREWNTKLRGGWGRGFRAPTLNDLFFPGFSNPNLRPESSEGWDVGVEPRFWSDRARFGLTWFHTSYRDLIQFDSTTNRPENISTARSEGLEATSELDLLHTLYLTGAYTFTLTENVGTGDELRRFPKHRWALGLSWDPLRALSLYTQVSVVSSQFESATRPRNPGHHRIDAGATYRLVEKRGHLPGVDFTLRVQNLTDQRYFEVFGFPAPGINFLAGLRAQY